MTSEILYSTQHYGIRLTNFVPRFRRYRLILAALQLKRFVAVFPPRRPGFTLGSSHVGFVVVKVALGQMYSEYFCFPCHSSFHQFSPQSPSPIIRDWYNRPEVAAVLKVPPR
jgi:hypothetical protein